MIKKFKNVNWKALATLALAFILVTGLVRGVYYVGVEVGRAFAGIF